MIKQSINICYAGFSVKYLMHRYLVFCFSLVWGNTSDIKESYEAIKVWLGKPHFKSAMSSSGSDVVTQSIHLSVRSFVHPLFRGEDPSTTCYFKWVSPPKILTYALYYLVWYHDRLRVMIDMSGVTGHDWQDKGDRSIVTSQKWQVKIGQLDLTSYELQVQSDNSGVTSQEL